MILAVLSDLHLGAKDALDRFHRTEGAETQLYAQLDALAREVDRIVFLGDVFETLRGRVPGAWATELLRGLHAYPELTRRLTKDPQYAYVHGNHDVVAREVLGAKERLVVEDHGLRLLFMHGHQLTWLERKRAPLSKLGCWAGATLERTGVRVTERIDGKEKPVLDAPTPFELRAIAAAKNVRADVVITGHSHDPKRLESGGVVFLNSGTRLAGRFDHLRLDTETQRFEVHRA